MKEQSINKKLQATLNDFVRNLQGIYTDNLISIILYGSGSSGEFTDKHSNLNLLVVLKDAALPKLKLSSGLINKWRFKLIHPLFFSEEYIKNSTDVFPIEFLDMKENYTVLLGRDILGGLSIDTKNLRYQCEQELKVKLIALRQFYLKNNKDRTALLNFLLKTFTSTLHILRNIIRLKGKTPHYLKEDIVEDVSGEFGIDKLAWQNLLAAKNRMLKLKRQEIDSAFVNFALDLEHIIGVIDKL